MPTSSPPPGKTTLPRGRPRNPDLLRHRTEQILTAATSHFARLGYQETDLQVIANELGIGKGTIYRYFATKESLFRATLARGLTELMTLINQKIPLGSDALACFASAIEAYLGFFRARPELVELFLIERAVFPGKGKSAYFVQREQDRKRWSEVFRELMGQGRVRQGRLDGMLDAIGDLLYGTMFANHHGGRMVAPEIQAKDILDLVFHGILGSKARKEFPDMGNPENGKVGKKQ